MFDTRVVAVNGLRYTPCTVGCLLGVAMTMLGHLVLGRYGRGSEQTALASPAPASLMRRLLDALLRRHH